MSGRPIANQARSYGSPSTNTECPSQFRAVPRGTANTAPPHKTMTRQEKRVMLAICALTGLIGGLIFHFILNF